ncbi:MAG TPA: glycosyl hydrolase [Epulopiscium sp.]|nr:glycosyl hydrolase [Candidatus Epulonipiscium sp.]
MKKQYMLLVVIVISAICLISCTAAKEKSKSNYSTDKKENLSVWNVYWDNEKMEQEIASLEDSINEICYFAAYFDSNHNLFVPEEVTDNFNRVKKEFKDKEYVHYLSIVNDKINRDGTSSLKDTNMLYQLFNDEKNLESHMNKIVMLAVEGGYDGIEIDYEGMKKDEQLWRLSVDYYRKLYEKLEKENLKMRIVLEPSLPTYDLGFPRGPNYIMMCYNLYGSGTEPGPKANPAFILELVDKMKGLPGRKSFAFATGGFDWGKGENVTPLTELQAKEIISLYKVTPTRDKTSKCVTFSYRDGEGVNHQVWFADGETLRSWVEVVKGKGYYNYSIWRLNGNDIDSLKQLK